MILGSVCQQTVQTDYNRLDQDPIQISTRAIILIMYLVVFQCIHCMRTGWVYRHRLNTYDAVIILVNLMYCCIVKRYFTNFNLILNMVFSIAIQTEFLNCNWLRGRMHVVSWHWIEVEIFSLQQFFCWSNFSENLAISFFMSLLYVCKISLIVVFDELVL